MSIILPVLAVAFAAFAVWLFVRIVNRRERWAKWTALAIGLPMLYLLGIGPVARFARDSWPGNWRCEAYRIGYYPVLRLCELDYDYEVPETINGGGAFHNAILGYLTFWGASTPNDYVDT